jgi:hypothetical protein
MSPRAPVSHAHRRRGDMAAMRLPVGGHSSWGGFDIPGSPIPSPLTSPSRVDSPRVACVFYGRIPFQSPAFSNADAAR